MDKDKVKVRYDPEADILYLLIREGEIKDTVEIAEGIFVEFDENEKIAGIEIWNARKTIFGELIKYLDRVKTAYMNLPR